MRAWVRSGSVAALVAGVLALAACAAAAPGNDTADIAAPVHSAAAPAAGPPGTSAVAAALARAERRLGDHPADPEARLIKGMLHREAGERERALVEFDALVRAVPEFHLARLLRDELTGEPPAELGGRSPEQLREEARLRLSRYLAPSHRARIPRALLRLGSDTPRAVVVDKHTHRLYLYENRGPDLPPRLVRDVYVSTGRQPGNKRVEGDLRTPEGVYFVTGHIPDRKLPEKYGIGAFPIDYPNALDRRLGKTGYGIWLHGMERAYFSRPPLDSEGCVVLSNADLEAITPELGPGTPVVIAEQIEWLDPADWQAERAAALTALEGWREAWERGDLEAYLAHYAEDFWAPRGHDRASWTAQRRAAARGKTHRRIRLSDVSLFAYPDAAAPFRPLFVARFRQEYASDNYAGRSLKQLYLTRGEDGWRVLYEAERSG